MPSRTITKGKGNHGKPEPFKSELRFTSKRRLTEREALNVAATILRGETPEGITVKEYRYGNRKINREASADTLERGDFAFTDHPGFTARVASAPSQARPKRKGAL